MILGLKIRSSIKVSAEEKFGILERDTNKICFGQECSDLANKRKQAKLLWLLNPKDQTADNFTNIRCDICRTFKKKKQD